MAQGRALAAAPTPTAAPGALVVAITPIERGVGSFAEGDPVPRYGDRNLRVGLAEGERQIGGLLFPLGAVPAGARLSSAVLELTGLSDAGLAAEGSWTVDLLDPEAAENWSGQSYARLAAAPSDAMPSAWRLGAADLAAGRLNRLAFSEAARAVLAERFAQGRVAFRISGPAEGAGDNHFAWDTGFGQGFGKRPVLRLTFEPAGGAGQAAGSATRASAAPTVLPATRSAASTGSNGPPATPAAARAEAGSPSALAAPTGGTEQARPAAAGAASAPQEARRIPAALPGFSPLLVWAAEPVAESPPPSEPGPGAPPRTDPLPAELRGMILFLSDRFGAPRLMVLDPASGRTGQLGEAWPYAAAKARQAERGGLRLRVEGEPCGAREAARIDPAWPCGKLLLEDRAAARVLALSPSGRYAAPALSPNGAWVAYVASGAGGERIFKLRREGGDPRPLTPAGGAGAQHPSWSPDGRRIVFWSTQGGRRQLFAMDADGGGHAPLAPSAHNDWDPVWVP